MLSRCDFDEQVSAVSSHDRGVRPDVLVRLPGDKCLVIDSKVPMTAFLAAQADSIDPSERARLLGAHAGALRAHVESLAAKAYWSAFTTTPEMVVCFVPGDAILASALGADPTLYEHAIGKKVVLASPGTLLALLRTVAFTWQQDALTANAQALLKLGSDLYSRLGTLGSHAAKMGASLQKSVESYNALVGALESRVMVTARKMNELGLADSPLDEIAPVEPAPRPLMAAELIVSSSDVLDPDRAGPESDLARVRGLGKGLAETRERADSGDTEMAQEAKAETARLEKSIGELIEKIKPALLPHDPLDDRPAIVEIRGGTGGDEAALFAADLLRMYTRFAEGRRWRIETISQSDGTLGGVKEAIFKIKGEGAFGVMRWESGVHRVQRVPVTESQGRIHTSTATVAVLPEAEEVDLELKPEDLRIEVCRSGGPGGQGVNTTDSAVQILHIPNGRIVRCQDGRSQQKNKEKALSIMRARLLEEKQREEEAKYSAHRRGQIGSGGREEKIRTYNYAQNRVTDHRIGLTLHRLPEILDGKMDELIGALISEDEAERLASLDA